MFITVITIMCKAQKGQQSYWDYHSYYDYSKRKRVIWVIGVNTIMLKAHDMWVLQGYQVYWG